MFVQIICVILFVSSVLTRNVPSFKDLDEDDKMLFRAAYDSYEGSYTNEAPSYNHDAPYGYDNYDNELGKLDLLKDGLWALKAKMKELKVFNKALAANLLLTKLQVKELLKHMKPLKEHQHVELDKKPAYSYQPPPPPSYPQYEHPHPQYTAPAPQYTAQHYGAPQPAHDPYYGH